MTHIDRSLLFTLAAVAFASFSPALAGDDKGETAKPAPAPAADSKIDADVKTDRSLREQEIYIPYEKLRGVFEKHGRGVFLPYEKFDELWKAAQDKTRPAAEAQPPVGAVITEIENEAVVAKDVVQVTAHIKIDLLSEGWHEVPLRLADAAIVRATIKNEPARLLGGANEDHRLLIEKKGKQPEQIELVLEYARAITRSPGQNSVSFQAPQAAVSRWKVRIPQAGVKVNLRPLIAATEVPPAAVPTNTPNGKKPSEEKKVDETVILAFVGAAPTVQIDWTPKSEGATGLTALASVQSEQQVWIQEGITRTRTTLAYAISRAELKQIAVEVPAEFKVVNVFDPNVRQWSVEPPTAGSTVQRITAQLFEPAKAAQTVVVELEKIVGQKRVESLKVPVVKALNVGRQQGFVVVQVSSGLRAETSKSSGLLQVDANELPLAMRSTAWTFAYRYASVPFELVLAVEEVAPRITVDSLVDARLEPEKLTLDLTAFYTIERAGVFKLEIDVPEGFELRNVTGRPGAAAAAPGTPPVARSGAEVDSFHLQGDKKTHLVVNLARKALGGVGLQVQLQRDLHEANLRTPTGKPAEIDLPLPQATKSTIEHSSGRLVIHAPESLQVNPAKADGLRPVSFQEAMEGISVQQPMYGGSGLRPVLAFVFTQEPVVLRLAAERRKPMVTIRQLLVARIDEGVIKYQATFFYSVQYSGVKSLRIDVPDDVAPLLRNTTAGIHEKTIDPPPADLDKNMVAWSLAGEGELLGDGQINLAWEKKLDKLDVGKTLEVTVPRLIPREVDRAWGQIALAKAETLDFQEAEDLMKGLRPIDPQRDLATPVSGAARAFEFYDDWSLPVTITRYELEEVKRTSIDRAVCRMVLTPAGETAVQAVYRVRSVRPRLTVQLPPDSSPDLDPFRINGQPITLQKGQGNALVVPLVTATAEEPFVLEIRYTVKGVKTFALPAFLDETATQKVYLCAFVPPTQDVVGTAGSWAEDFEWRWGNQHRWVPINAEPHESKVEWVCEGNPGALGAAKSFHIDGTPLIFSTLRPEAQTDVRLWTLNHEALGAWIFGVVLLAGVLLVRTSLATRVIAVAVLIVALVLLGVFWPTLSLHVFGCPLFAAAGIVLLFWAVVGLFRLHRPLMDLCAALNTTWSTWVASRKATVQKAPPAAGQPQEQLPASDGGASHG
ncbi:MAG: hypothetical protein ACLP9L_38785 [Thermoguttaceae bacterium]